MGPIKTAAETIYPLLADDRGWEDENSLRDTRDLAYPVAFANMFKAMVRKKLRSLERENKELVGELVGHVSAFRTFPFKSISPGKWI